MTDTLPRILIGGFARTGTSAVTMLVTMLGFPAGRNLKVGAASNPRGYWESLPIRNLTWKAAKVERPHLQHLRGTMPDEPLPLQDHPVRAKIRRLAREQNTVVYKDSYLPMLYKLFAPDAKYVVVLRDWQAAFKSALATKWRDQPPEEFREAFLHYYRLAGMMAQDVDTWFVQYEAFCDDFDAEVRRLATFLGVPFEGKLEAMRTEWYPNEEWYRRQGITRAQWPEWSKGRR